MGGGRLQALPICSHFYDSLFYHWAALLIFFRNSRTVGFISNSLLHSNHHAIHVIKPHHLNRSFDTMPFKSSGLPISNLYQFTEFCKPRWHFFKKNVCNFCNESPVSPEVILEIIQINYSVHKRCFGAVTGHCKSRQHSETVISHSMQTFAFGNALPFF